LSNNMKHSGIEWIGNIPSDWEIKKLKYVTRLRNEIGRLYDDDIYLGLENIESSTGKYIQTETEYDDGFYSVVKKGDILFGKLRPYLEKVYMSDIDGFCSGEFVNFKEFNGEKRYLFYFLLSHGFIEIVNSSTYGAKMPRAEWEYIKNLNIPMPILYEQNAIAAFLDTQCNKIDNIITELEQQIEILKQYKTSLITETVTKGLNKNVPMKNSGIDWIGKIPAHWEVGRIKYCYDIVLGKMLQPVQEGNKDREVHYMCAVNVTWDGIDLSILKKMWFSPSEVRMYLLQKGDLLVTEGGDVAIACIWNNELQECCIQNALHLIRNNGKNLNSFLYYWLYFLKHTGYIDLVCNKATITHFTKEKFGESPICTIPVEEQKAISNFLDEKLVSINQMIKAKQQSIDTMKAYKKSLIYEYVTGKKRVNKK